MSPSTSDQALQALLAHGRARAADVDGYHASLWDALATATVGGKRFRPALLAAAHRALGGAAHDAAATTGAAIELLHTAFLIHDDVIDGDDVRRGRLNVSGAARTAALASGAAPCDAETLSRTAGILAGDLALTAAIRAVATCGAPLVVVHRLLDLFDTAIHTTAAGELADVHLSLRIHDASVEESLAMAEQKTSAYSFVLPLQAGAVLADADDRTVERLGEAGRFLGIAFQLADDLHGVFGDPARTGKSVTSDLRAGKQTPLVAHARSTPEWEHIEPHVGRDLTEDDLDEVRRLLTASGSRGVVEDLVAAHRAAARAVLEDLGLPPDLFSSVVFPAPRTPGRVAAA